MRERSCDTVGTTSMAHPLLPVRLFTAAALVLIFALLCTVNVVEASVDFLSPDPISPSQSSSSSSSSSSFSSSSSHSSSPFLDLSRQEGQQTHYLDHHNHQSQKHKHNNNKNHSHKLKENQHWGPQPYHQHKVRHSHDHRHLRRRHLLDNRHQPKFTHTEYQQTVNENLPVHSSILQVHATDDDLDDNGLIQYRVSDTEHFAIDEGGVLYNIKPLDFEHTNGEYLLYIYAEDQGVSRANRLQSMVPALVRVIDTREPPYFDSSAYFFHVSEFAGIGSYVGTVVARDADGDFSRYELSEVTPSSMFNIDPVTGIITVGQDSFNEQWIFEFSVSAHDESSQSSSVPVTVNIIDENTHRPIFTACDSYNGVSVQENGTAGMSVVLVRATDDDHGDNGVVTYYLLNDFDSFQIVTENGQGKITTTRKLDRDGDDKEFFLTVVARDKAPTESALQEACSFKVVVEDINDNPPIFDKQLYEQNIATDHAAHKAVLRVTATDMDAGDNANISYSLEGNMDDLEYFSVAEATGVITLVKELTDNMADTQTFSMTAVATDRGLSPLSSNVPVTIKVVSSGNLPPSIISKDPPQPTIPEDAPLDFRVMTVCGQSNIPGQPNVYITLINGNTKDTNEDGTFAYRDLEADSQDCPGDSQGGIIYVAMRNLDYESITTYKLILQVVNDQNARLDEQIIVDILDVNDNAPLLQPFDGAVVENTDAALITTIQAVDKDVSPEFKTLTYNFDDKASDIVKETFELKPNGELWTRFKLNREEEPKYRIPIQVSDGLPAHNRVTAYWITVHDINDVAPVFDMEAGVYEVLLPEKREVGKNTGIKLKVIDPDIVNHNDFQIVEGNAEQKFRIDSTTGDVLVNKKLDYDYPGLDRDFTMKVRLSDGANQVAETIIRINVTNENDLQPVFEQSNYTFSISENVDCDMVFGTVKATDPDLPPDADQNIRYALEDLKNFTIGEVSGELSVKGCLDREATKLGMMSLYPNAMDEGGHGYDADPTTVYLTILDINDNHPFIQSPDNSYAKFMENADPSTVQHVNILLGDIDSEENGCPCTLEFESFTSADIKANFGYSPVPGLDSQYNLFPLVMLDREAQKIYNIPFRTTDSKGFQGTRYLTLEVGDENDSPMSDGFSTIKVYNYQGQFPAMVVGSVYVTDMDDHDVNDKTFEIDPTTPGEAGSHFEVDFNSGNITMLKDTPEGVHVLKVKVHDKVRNETAIGTVELTVVDLTEEAIMQSGSFTIANRSSIEVIAQNTLGSIGTSLYDGLKEQLAKIHGITSDHVDIFTLHDVDGGVNVRYNCHSSPYYTAARLNGLFMMYRLDVMAALGVDITRVDINDCLYEATSPCGLKSCQHALRPDLTSPLLVTSGSSTMVGVNIFDNYACDCGPLEPLPSVCYKGFCHNGGVCNDTAGVLSCNCPDKINYGPHCELLSARFEKGYAWYEPLTVCDNSSFSMSFQSREKSGVILYSGPTVTLPWPDYPKDFIYVLLKEWVLEIYMEMGTGTINLAIPLEENVNRYFDYKISWNDRGITFEVINCNGNNSVETPESCKKHIDLIGLNTPSFLLNIQGPLQLGGFAAIPDFGKLASSYGWDVTPPMESPLYGCIMDVRHNDHLYDLNSTDYDKYTYKPCDAPKVARVILGSQSIIIIVVSLLFLLMLVLLILCLARRGRKTVSYPELDGIVKETIGGTDLEGYGEKDMNQYDLKLLRVAPDGYAYNGDEERRLPDVADDTRQLRAPLATMPDGLSIGDFINDNIKKVDKDPADFDDVRHYCFEGDEMSIASLSSLGSGGSSDNENPFDQNDWGPRFEKLNQLYKRDSDEEDDSEFEFPNVPRQRKRHSLMKSSPPSNTKRSSPNGAKSPPAGNAPERPTVTFAEPGSQSGSSSTGSGSDGQSPESRPGYHEAVNPLSSAFERVGGGGAESWC